MRRFTSIALVVAVLLFPATMYAGQPVRNLLRKVLQPVATVVKAQPVRSAFRGVYQSVGQVRAGQRNYGSTGGYGSTGTNYGSTGSSTVSYGSTGGSVSYVLK